MMPNLKKHIERLPEYQWKAYREDSEAVRECADVLNWLTAPPKRIRFQMFCSPGKLVSYARQTWLPVRRLKEQLTERQTRRNR
jgi:hypothetical protein